MANTDLYAELGVDRTATVDEIQRAYRKLARTWHPDVNKSPEAEDRFKRIGAAYDVLSDPDLRLGKIMRRLLRDLAEERPLGDVSSLAETTIVNEIKATLNQR